MEIIAYIISIGFLSFVGLAIIAFVREWYRYEEPKVEKPKKYYTRHNL